MNTQNTEIENEMPKTIFLVSTAAPSTEVTDVENKIPDITNLAIRTNLNIIAVEIDFEIPNTSSFITTPEFNRLTKMMWCKFQPF